MAKFTADFHIHSKYSRATSKDMDLDHISCWAKIKGIDVIGTGDFTHPAWFKELKAKLIRAQDGMYDYKGTRFILTAEVSNIYTKYGKGRRIHNIILAPDIDSAEKVKNALSKRGNILSDGRPIFGFDAKDLVKICMDISNDIMIIPAHIWTPWFSLFGSMSGFDSVEECFEEQANNIYALETGLSADPAMCRRLSMLDKYSLVSNSDAHSPAKLGREANIFDTELSYNGIRDALKKHDTKRFLYTIEFFPEEGKYHYDGHRQCRVSCDPATTKAYGNICPVCNKQLTIGVLNRVDQLADRAEGRVPGAIPYKRLVPLIEIISAVYGKGVTSKQVISQYQLAIQQFVNEFNVLLDAGQDMLTKYLGPAVSEAVLNIRHGNVHVEPGYDGVYGKIGFVEHVGVLGHAMC
jgi:DNA helicase II / ATP-dependent DNA helicase PcrA